MPEEFFFMLLEVLAGTVYGITPATLNKLILQYRYISRAIQDWIQKLRLKNNSINFSVDNKFGHTQKPEDLCGDNFHVDHHLYHMKNFGIYNCLMDMYFETSVNNDKYMIKPSLYHPGEKEIVFNVEKKVEEDKVIFHFTPKAWNTKLILMV